MGTKKLTDFTPQTVLNYTTRLYGVPYSGTGAFTDTQVPITVLFDNTTFTGTTTVATLAATTVTAGGVPVVTTTGTQTLTNKTLTSPTISTIVNTGTLTLPTSTDTLVGRNTTDTLTNKTLTSPTITGGSMNNTPIGATTQNSGQFTTISASGAITPNALNGLVGTTTNNNANAGAWGEYNESISGAVALTSNVTTNITSVSLTAGDYEVWGNITYVPTGGTITNIFAGVNNVSATFPAGLYLWSQSGTVSIPSGTNGSIQAFRRRFSLSATTTIYLIGNAAFGAGTATATGILSWRRIR